MTTWRPSPEPDPTLNWTMRKRIITRVSQDLGIRQAAGEFPVEELEAKRAEELEKIFRLIARRERTPPRLAGKRATGSAYRIVVAKQTKDARGSKSKKSAIKAWETPATRRQRHADLRALSKSKRQASGFGA